MRPSLPQLTRFFDFLLMAGGALAGLLMIVIMAMVCTKVFMRYVLGIGWLGVDQISGSLLLYITFLGAAWVLSREEHVTIDFLFGQLSAPRQRQMTVVTSTICALVCMLVFAYGVNEVIYSWNRGFLVAAELEIPRAANLAIIPVGCLLLWIQFIRRALHAASDGVKTGKNLKGSA